MKPIISQDKPKAFSTACLPFPLLVFPGEPQPAPLLCVPQAAPPLPEAGAFTRMKRTPGLHHWEIVTLMKTLF